MLSPGREARRGEIVARVARDFIRLENETWDEAIELSEEAARWLMVAALPELLQGADR
jgi:hypothetical protein